jgi:hypothetical protein
MSQPHLSNNLDKIIQMISIEQLLGLMKQMKSNCDADTNTNTNTNTNTDVLSLPIVKNVINAYEQEIKALTTNTNTNTNTNIIPFASEITKITEQLDKINNNLLVIVEKINSMESDFKLMQTNAQVSKLNDDEEHIVLKIEERDIKENDAFESINIADDDCESECSDDEFIKEIKASLAKMEKGEAQEVEEEEDELVSEAEELEEESAQAISEAIVVKEEELEEESAQAVSEAEELEEEQEEESAQAISEAEVEEESAQAIEEEVVSEAEEVVSEEAEEDTEPEISDDSDEDVKEVSKVEEVKQEEEEEEEEVFEIEIDDVTYYATHEENGILYEVDKDGEVGKKIGIIKDGEPIFS